jgi:hypothetical protein
MHVRRLVVLVSLRGACMHSMHGQRTGVRVPRGGVGVTEGDGVGVVELREAVAAHAVDELRDAAVQPLLVVRLLLFAGQHAREEHHTPRDHLPDIRH